MRPLLIGFALGVLLFGLFRSWMIIPSWVVVLAIGALGVAVTMPLWRRGK